MSWLLIESAALPPDLIVKIWHVAWQEAPERWNPWTFCYTTQVVQKRSLGECQAVANGRVGSCHPLHKSLGADSWRRVWRTVGLAKLSQDELLLKNTTGRQERQNVRGVVCNIRSKARTFTWSWEWLKWWARRRCFAFFHNWLRFENLMRLPLWGILRQALRVTT